MISKPKRKLKPAARAAMSAGGKEAQQRRWGSPRAESTMLRISRDVADEFRRTIPEADRRTVADDALRAAISKWKETHHD